MNPHETLNREPLASLSEQAAHWWVVMNESEPTAAERHEFAEWIAKSPERIEAYLEITALRRALRKDRVRWPDTSADTLIREARASGGDVVTLAPSAAALASSPDRFVARRWRVGASLAATVLLAVIGVGLWFLTPTHYRTSLGEQRSILLADGSVVTLNTSSEIDVELGKTRRVVHLTQGEALFQVAHDVARPFDVVAGETTIRAVGTEFNVDRREARTTVTVIEGRVLVDRVPVAATERVIVEATKVSAPERLANLAPVTAWTQRRLIFEGRPLQEVAEEFNRYNREKIEIDDAGLKAEAVTGVFAANDAVSFIAFLKEIPNVEVREAEDGTHIVTLRGPN